MGWGPLGEGYQLSGTLHAPHSPTSPSGCKAMGPSVRAESQKTPSKTPCPAHRPGTEAHTCWSLENFGEPDLLHQVSTQTSRTERATRVRMGRTTWAWLLSSGSGLRLGSNISGPVRSGLDLHLSFTGAG